MYIWIFTDSDDNRSANNSLADENASHLKYEENSDYTFHQVKCFGTW